MGPTISKATSKPERSRRLVSPPHMDESIILVRQKRISKKENNPDAEFDPNGYSQYFSSSESDRDVPAHTRDTEKHPEQKGKSNPKLKPTAKVTHRQGLVQPLYGKEMDNKSYVSSKGKRKFATNDARMKISDPSGYEQYFSSSKSDNEQDMPLKAQPKRAAMKQPPTKKSVSYGYEQYFSSSESDDEPFKVRPKTAGMKLSQTNKSDLNGYEQYFSTSESDNEPYMPDEAKSRNFSPNKTSPRKSNSSGDDAYFSNSKSDGNMALRSALKTSRHSSIGRKRKFSEMPMPRKKVRFEIPDSDGGEFQDEGKGSGITHDKKINSNEMNVKKLATQIATHNPMHKVTQITYPKTDTKAIRKALPKDSDPQGYSAYFSDSETDEDERQNETYTETLRRRILQSPPLPSTAEVLRWRSRPMLRARKGARY